MMPTPMQFLAESVEREQPAASSRSRLLILFIAGIACGLVFGYFAGKGWL
jgi:hypothetical protein